MKYHFIKTVIISIIFVAISNVSNLNAQNTIKGIPVLDSLDVAKAVNYFTINNGLLEGRGADLLKDHISNSKFFVLGENHFSTQVSRLTESLVPVLHKSGYSVATFEVGPLSAEKLKELSKMPDSTEARLKSFNAQYFTPSLGMSAIPMFNAIDDAAFLKAFAEKEMEIWGIDQEFVFSALFLGDDMVESMSDDPAYEEIKTSWIGLKDTLKALYEQMPRKVLTRIITHPDFQEFEKMFDSDDHYAQEVLKRLHESMKIYESHHKVRVDYLRSNFLTNYMAFEKDNKDARYFIKIGSMHAANSNYSHGYYDLGALTKEIAKVENVKSTNVIIPRATYGGKDYRDLMPSLLNFHKKDRWTIIDLQKLHDDLNSNKFQIIAHPDSRELNRMIRGFDLLLIPPSDKKPIDNW